MGEIFATNITKNKYLKYTKNSCKAARKFNQSPKKKRQGPCKCNLQNKIIEVIERMLSFISNK